MIVLLPDVVPVAVAWLTDNTHSPEVVALFADRIGTQLPALEVWPALRIDPIGGFAPVEYRLDQPVLQVHSFDLTDLGAMTGARTARASLFAMVGHRAPGVLVVCDVTTSSPQLLPDESRTPPISHSTFSATFTVRPDP